MIVIYVKLRLLVPITTNVTKMYIPQYENGYQFVILSNDLVDIRNRIEFVQSTRKLYKSLVDRLAYDSSIVALSYRQQAVYFLDSLKHFHL